MVLPGCTLVASDTASIANPLPFWGNIDCEESSRQTTLPSGGDTHPQGSGTPQPDSAFRRLTVMDGDDVWGERCELGFDWALPTDPGNGRTGPGPTVFYDTGERRATFVSIRLGRNIDPQSSGWRTVLQMKQTEPYNNPEPSPVFELEVRNGTWVMEDSWHDYWSAPAQAGVWTRFAFDITYSADPSVGAMKAYADLNGDGDFADPHEQSPLTHVATLRTETRTGGSSPWRVGNPIPSHLRAGIYEDPSHSCPGGCSVDIDNVQVLGP